MRVLGKSGLRVVSLSPCFMGGGGGGGIGGGGIMGRGASHFFFLNMFDTNKHSIKL
jgi:hypothetical protein